jgi:hypothetical protein
MATTGCQPANPLLLEDLGRLLQDGLGYGQTQGLSGLEVDDEVEPGDLLDW